MTAGRYVVPPDLDGERADRVVSKLTGLSRSAVRSAIDSGGVLLDGAPVRPGRRLPQGAVVEVAYSEPETGLQPEEVAFTIAYLDDDVAVVDKPAGVVVHPGAGTGPGTLAAGLLHRWPELEGVGDEGRWGIVHRLDRETSGLLIVARTASAHRVLRAALRRHLVRRTYTALVTGTFDIERGTIDAPLGRDPRRPTRFRVEAGGRPARTHYRRLASWDGPGPSLLEVELETGRTHQIRVHLASIGHPVVGDTTYGTGPVTAADPGRVWLHASRLVFAHPATRREVDVHSELPPDLAASLASLGPPDRGEVPGPGLPDQPKKTRATS